MAKYKLKIKLKLYQCTPKDPPYSTIRWLIQRLASSGRACPGQFMSSAADRGLNWTESRSRALKKRWMAGNSTASSQSDILFLAGTWMGWNNWSEFLPFSERIANIDVDIFHKVGNEYESESDEQTSYLYQTVEKWSVLNLSEGYDTFRREIRADNYITLPQVLLSKDNIVEVLKKHLKYKNPLCLQSLL
ncbi:hypothetical protein NQ317_001254, partial [Molorchus minor]